MKLVSSVTMQSNLTQTELWLSRVSLAPGFAAIRVVGVPVSGHVGFAPFSFDTTFTFAVVSVF